MPHWVSPAQLAKQLGISYAAVTTAINKGRLCQSIRKNSNGRYQVNLESALQEWAENTDVVKAQNAYSSKETSITTTPQSTEKTTRPNVPPFNESRAVKEAYQARLAKLDYEERNGQLIPADRVKVEAFKLARTVRDALLNIPERISSELAAETHPHKIHQLLQQEINTALELLVNNLKNE